MLGCYLFSRNHCAQLALYSLSHRLKFCDAVPGSFQACPVGETNCPVYEYCWLECHQSQVGLWLTEDDNSKLAGSAYYGGALCEQFPRDPSYKLQSGEEVQYLMNVGPPYVPRFNFDDFYWSLITVFVLLSQDGWSLMMFDAMRSGGPENPATQAYCIYFLLVIVVGMYLILNLFLAILIDGFQKNKKAHEEEDQELDEEVTSNAASAIKTLRQSASVRVAGAGGVAGVCL